MKETMQGFDVYVKDRFIVKGQKKYQERFIKINKKPMDQRNALGYGGTIVDNSAARSFYIKPTKGLVVKPDISISGWDILMDKFYKRNNNFIERTDFAIDTSGEIREISARGWISERRKLQPKPLKIKPVKTKQIIGSRKDIMDMKDLRRSMII